MANTRKMVWAAVLVVVAMMTAGVARTAHGQTVDLSLFTCEPFAGYPVECRGVLGETGLNASVFVSNAQGLTQEYFAAQLYVDSGAGAVMSLLPALSYECGQLYMRLWCPTFLQPCQEVGPPLSRAIPRPPCQEVCREFNHRCAGAGGVPAMDCALSNPLAGGPLWPNFTTTVVEQLAPCGSVPLDELGPLQVICPPGSVFFPEGDPKVPPPQPMCALPCSDFLTIGPGYLKGYLQASFLQLNILACVSMGFVLVVIGTWLLFPSLREWPRRIVLFMAVGVFFEMLGWIGNLTYGSTAGLMCEGDDIHLRPFISWCGFQAWSVMFGSLVVICWWITQGFVLFWNVGLMKNPKHLAKFEPVFHFINWCFPLISSLVFVGRKELGPLPGYAYCFALNDAPLVVVWIFFWDYLMVGIFLVALFLSVTMIRLCRESTLKSTFWDRWKYQLQLGTFALYFLITITYVMAFRLWGIEVNGDQITRGNFEYIYQCVLVAEGGASCETPLPLNHYLIFSQGVLLGIQGIMLFVLFLLMNEFNRNLWVLAYRNIKEGRALTYLPQGGSTTTGGSSGSTTSSSDDAKQRRSNRKLRRKMANEAPEV